MLRIVYLRVYIRVQIINVVVCSVRGGPVLTVPQPAQLIELIEAH